MQITENYFKSILADLIDENPIACRGVLAISEVEFTEEIPTLAMTLSERPRLCVNLDFANKHCKTEEHLKAVIIHEFLHVLLGHTEKFKRVTRSLSIALDAVINSIIHRTLGSSYSGMMSSFYRDSKGVMRLLRPVTKRDKSKNQTGEPHFVELWSAVYDGKFVVDDLLDIAEQVKNGITNGDANRGETVSEVTGEENCGADHKDCKEIFLGNHDPASEQGELPETLEKKLQETLASMNGGGIWRNPRDHGVGRKAYPTGSSAKSMETRHWETTAIKALKECITPDRHSVRTKTVDQQSSLPVLNEGDRRGFMRSLWSPLLPEIVWSNKKNMPEGTTQIYLDVSGSMNREMERLVSLIWKLRRFIREPFWAFSDSVEQAVIKGGRLETNTSGGTSMNCVLRHIAETRPGKAVVITDGYIEKCSRSLLKQLNAQQMYAIVSRDGSPAELKRARIPYVQLERFHND
jgi:hypothetical protein